MYRLGAKKAWLACILSLAIGVAIGWFVHIPPADDDYETVSYRDKFSGYKFISPFLYLSGVPEEAGLPQYGDLKNSLDAYVKKVTSSGDVTRASVYFRDLTSNKWIGIDQSGQYSPASLLKVSILVTFLKMAEKDPSLLSAKIDIGSSSVDASSDLYQYYPPSNPVKLGQTYGTQELLSRMITESDNNAAAVFGQFIGQDALIKTSRDLNMITASSSIESLKSTPVAYSHLFRILYNGTYLSHDLSEQALALLSKTTFTGGLVAGTATGTVVSHKFGETSVSSNGVILHQLHDCGIVYDPEHPYFLCVMTEGTKDFPVLQNVIKDISAIAWNKVGKI